MATENIEPAATVISEEVEKVKDGHKSFGDAVLRRVSVASIDPSTKEGQVFSMIDVDPALDEKMRLVNAVRYSPTDPDISGLSADCCWSGH